MIVIASIPFVDTLRALAAPAVLKSSLLKFNIKSFSLDLNHEIFTMVNASTHKELLYQALLYNNFSETVIPEFTRLVKYCANRILSKNPTLIALSLFCFNCRIFCNWLCAELKQHTNCTIVIGGPGIDSVIWLEEIRGLGLIDDFIMGDGEDSFVEYVLGNKNFPGINEFHWQPVANFLETPIPNYDDYNFYSYAEPSIPLIDSRGCVQSCEFCDVIERWNKFQYKTADRIFKEMLTQIEKYEIYHFDFRSSISNGNFKEFNLLMNLIADFNTGKFRSEQISWEGSFIIRDSKNEKIFETIGKTNASLFMGVKSINEHTRKNLGKNFSNAALNWTLEQIEKNNLSAKLLLIADYPTETLDDYESTKNWFIENHRYAKVLREINFSRAGIIPNTQLDRKSETYGIEKKSPTIWMNTRLGITEEIRKLKSEEIINLVKSLGFKVANTV